MRAGSPDFVAPAVPVCRDASSLAWEVLRRDPTYRAAYAVWTGQSGTTFIEPAFATRWGLHFP